MYTIGRGPSKLTTRTRGRVLPQKLDSLESQRSGIRRSQDSTSETTTVDMSLFHSRTFRSADRHLGPPRKLMSTDQISTVPKPVFHQVNGKRCHSQRGSPEISPMHEEIVKYISDDWERVYHEYKVSKQDEREHKGTPHVTYYQDGPNPILQNFRAFDLEAWWGQRMYHNLTQST